MKKYEVLLNEADSFAETLEWREGDANDLDAAVTLVNRLKDALEEVLTSKAIPEWMEVAPGQWGCKGEHRGPCGEGLHHHHDEKCRTQYRRR